MKVSDFQLKRSFINTTDFPCSYNKTHVPMRTKCGVYRFNTVKLLGMSVTLLCISQSSCLYLGTSFNIAFQRPW